MGNIYLTTLSTDNYLVGVLVLAKNIKEYCNNKLVILVSDDLEMATYKKLEHHQIQYITMEKVTVSKEIIEVMGKTSYFGHWINTLFKLKVFDLIHYNKIVYVDSDMMVQESLDDLFMKEDMSAVIAGKSYPGNETFEDINSGIFVFVPRVGLSDELMRLISEVAKKKKYFGDQDVLTAYFKDWKSCIELHLPEEYNVFWRYYDFYYKKGPVKVVHFIGKMKPWMMTPWQVFIEYLKCIKRGNIRSIGIMMKYRKYIKSVW